MKKTKKMKETKKLPTTINVHFPEEKVKEYLKKFAITSLGKAEERQIQSVFLQAIRDFLSGNLCLDEFSSISNLLWWEGGVMPKREKTNKEFYNMLQLVGELSFYIRGGTKEVRKSALWVLNLVFDYYEKYSKK